MFIPYEISPPPSKKKKKKKKKWESKYLEVLMVVEIILQCLKRVLSADNWLWLALEIFQKYTRSNGYCNELLLATNDWSRVYDNITLFCLGLLCFHFYNLYLFHRNIFFLFHSFLASVAYYHHIDSRKSTVDFGLPEAVPCQTHISQ